MAVTSTQAHRISGICSCVPSKIFDNIKDCTTFPEDDIRKVIGIAGIAKRHVSGDKICSSDLCTRAAEVLIDELCWERESIDAIIMVTQSPDYFLPTTACVIQKNLALADTCAAFDVGLGCSGYPYGFWLASMMLDSGAFKRILLLHGETPSRFTDERDRSVFLLFGDVGSATALEYSSGNPENRWHFLLYSDGKGYEDMIMRAGGFRQRTSEDPLDYCVHMDGAKIFNFTIKRVPPLVRETLKAAELEVRDVDYYIFHQSNRFIMMHLAKQLKLPEERIPFTLENYGNTGGSSIPLTITQGNLDRSGGKDLRLMILGYGVGLSWASGLINLPSSAILKHIELINT